MVSTLRGRLIGSNNIESRYNGQIFYVSPHGRRHHVYDGAWIAANGFTTSDIHWVANDTEITCLAMGGAAPRGWTVADWHSPPQRTREVLCEIAASQLNGEGVEFGAGAYPLPIPVRCNVHYVDIVTAEQMRSRYFPGEEPELVEPELITGIEEMAGIGDESLDFVIACHVIEHTRNPLGVFERVYRKLRPGGQFVLLIPDKERTFDKPRDITCLEHLVSDYQDPQRERDFSHYVEFHTKAFSIAEELRNEAIKSSFERNEDIHYHTWTYDSFMSMVEYARHSISPWTSVWSQPTPPGAIEFFFTLTK